MTIRHVQWQEQMTHLRTGDLTPTVLRRPKRNTGTNWGMGVSEEAVCKRTQQRLTGDRQGQERKYKKLELVLEQKRMETYEDLRTYSDLRDSRDLETGRNESEKLQREIERVTKVNSREGTGIVE